jgi:hypothetical protein
VGVIGSHPRPPASLLGGVPLGATPGDDDQIVDNTGVGLSTVVAVQGNQIGDPIMDERTFDDVVRRWSMAGSRRGVLKSAFASTLAGLGIASLVDVDDAEAKSCKKKCKDKKDKKKRKECKKKCQTPPGPGTCTPTKAPQEACSSDNECCPAETTHICGFSHGGGTVNKTCCGTQGATCINALTCCVPLLCVSGQCM